MSSRFPRKSTGNGSCQDMSALDALDSSTIFYWNTSILVPQAIGHPLVSPGARLAKSGKDMKRCANGFPLWSFVYYFVRRSRQRESVYCTVCFDVRRTCSMTLCFWLPDSDVWSQRRAVSGFSWSLSGWESQHNNEDWQHVFLLYDPFCFCHKKVE